MNTIVQCVPEQSEHEVRACEPRSPPRPRRKSTHREMPNLGRGNDYRDKYPKPRDEPVELTPNARAFPAPVPSLPRQHPADHYANRGFAHTEGGWPSDVDPTEVEHVLRYRKKIEKDEEYAATIAVGRRGGGPHQAEQRDRHLRGVLRRVSGGSPQAARTRRSRCSATRARSSRPATSAGTQT